MAYLEAEDPERVLRELAASDAPFDSCYSGRIRKLFGFDLAQLGRAASGELLYAWRDDAGERARGVEKAMSDHPRNASATRRCYGGTYYGL